MKYLIGALLAAAICFFGIIAALIYATEIEELFNQKPVESGLFLIAIFLTISMYCFRYSGFFDYDKCNEDCNKDNCKCNKP